MIEIIPIDEWLKSFRLTNDWNHSGWQMIEIIPIDAWLKSFRLTNDWSHSEWRMIEIIPNDEWLKSFRLTNDCNHSDWRMMIDDWNHSDWWMIEIIPNDEWLKSFRLTHDWNHSDRRMIAPLHPPVFTCLLLISVPNIVSANSAGLSSWNGSWFPMAGMGELSVVNRWFEYSFLLRCIVIGYHLRQQNQGGKNTPSFVQLLCNAALIVMLSDGN